MRKEIILVGILLGMLLLPNVLAYQNEWEASITIKTNTNKTDIVVVGEKPDASDGKDRYDVPKCPSPPSNYISIWSNAGITIPPYQRLMKDYRLHGISKTWKLYIYLDSGISENVLMTWNRAAFKYSGYNSVSLYYNGVVVANMLKQTSYGFVMDPYTVQQFSIVCT